MSQFGQKVVAVIDTTSAFGVTIKDLKDNQNAIQNSLSILMNDAPEALDTLKEIATAIADNPAFFSAMASANTTLQNNIDSLATAAAAARTALETAVNAAIDERLPLTGGTLTGSLVVHKDWPDVQLKSNQEKRVLFTDAGGGATGAIKNVSSSLDFFAGGVAAGNKEMSVTSTGVDVEDRLTTGQFNIPTAAPGSPIDGDIYFDKTALKMKVYVDDGSSASWVEV